MSRPCPAILTAVLVVALVVAACSAPTPESTGSTDRVSAVVLPWLTFMPFHIAAAEGYYEDEDLDVEFVRLGRNQDVMAALANGDVDVSAGMITVNELNLVARGAHIRIVAGMGRLAPGHCTFSGIAARREVVDAGALADPERLRELRFDADILIPFGYWLDEFLAPLDLTVDDLDLVNLPTPAALEAMRNGSIDVTLETEPFLGMYEDSDHASVVAAANELVPGYQIGVILYGPRLLDEQPGVGRRFAAAMIRAMGRYNEGKTPRNLEIAAAATGLDPERLEGACWPDIRADGRYEPTGLRGFQEWALSYGLVDRVLENAELYDDRFVDGASAEPGR